MEEAMFVFSYSNAKTNIVKDIILSGWLMKMLALITSTANVTILNVNGLINTTMITLWRHFQTLTITLIIFQENIMNGQSLNLHNHLPRNHIQTKLIPSLGWVLMIYALAEAVVSFRTASFIIQNG